ncbi:SMEK domain-containing protein, partial [Candidatus Uhrbacteria bacterium]|nr:SMEK domain-containing protein [Candidatus Uhrbacteria bacterium]
MFTSKGALVEKIQIQLSHLVVYVASRNAISFTDASKESEDFFCGFLNLLLGTKLVNANLFEENTATIDLSDV